MPLTFDRAEFELLSTPTNDADLWWCEVRLFLGETATGQSNEATLRVTIPVHSDTTVGTASAAAQAAAIPLLEAALNVLRTRDLAMLDHRRRQEATDPAALGRRLMERNS